MRHRTNVIGVTCDLAAGGERNGDGLTNGAVGDIDRVKQAVVQVYDPDGRLVIAQHEAAERRLADLVPRRVIEPVGIGPGGIRRECRASIVTGVANGVGVPSAATL